MKTKVYFILFGMLFLSVIVFAQEWQQTASTPEGGGVTELVVNPENGHIFVTTASFDWPMGDKGGIRRSTDDGNTWENLVDVYNGRTITYGTDGNLYASYWPYPAHEGLYRSADNGDTWELLTMIAFGDNIFCVTVSTLTNPHTILAGTRDGVWRSTDNGTTWASANTGIPWATWVRDIEVDSAGIVVAATTAGVLSSEDNGDTWQQATGAGIENDTITKIMFDYPLDGKDYLSRLLAGSSTGNVYESFGESKYLMATMLEIFNGEASGVFVYMLKQENKKMHGIATFPKGTQPSGFNYSADDGASWQQNNNGLPGAPSPPISSLSGISTNLVIQIALGLFENTNGGAKVYRTTYDWSAITGVEDRETNLQTRLNLCQNFPNPFDYITSISYFLENAGHTNLEVYSSDGRLVKTLLDNWQSSGEHQITFNSDGLDNGIYFYKLDSNDFSEVRKMIILK